MRYNNTKKQWKDRRLTEMKIMKNSENVSALKTSLSHFDEPKNQPVIKKRITKRASMLIENSVKSVHRRNSIIKLDLDKAFRISQSQNERTLKNSQFSVNLPEIVNPKEKNNSIYMGQNPYIMFHTGSKHINSTNGSFLLENSMKSNFMHGSLQKNDISPFFPQETVMYPYEKKSTNENLYGTSDHIVSLKHENSGSLSPKTKRGEKLIKKTIESEKIRNSLLTSFEKMESLEEKTHISSRINLEKKIKDSFRPSEFLKLEAYKKYEELKGNLHYFEDVKGKKKLEDLNKFTMPVKLKKRIEDLKNKSTIKSKAHYSNELYTFSPSFKKKKTKIHHDNNNNKTENSEKIEQEYKIAKVKKPQEILKNLKFLPLKYSANNLIKENQHYMLTPMNYKRLKTLKKNDFPSGNVRSNFSLDLR